MSQRLNEAFAHLRVTEDIRSVSAFALALGYDRTYVSNAINGKTADFPKGIFTRLCDTYPGVFDLNYLMTGVGSLLLGEPAADGADGRVQDLLERIADLEELVATQRLLIETLRDRLRSLGVEYVAPALPSRRHRPNAMDSEASSLPSRSPRQYPVNAAASSTFSLPAAEQAESPSPASGAIEKPGNASPSGQSVSPKTDKP